MVDFTGGGRAGGVGGDADTGGFDGGSDGTGDGGGGDDDDDGGSDFSEPSRGSLGGGSPAAGTGGDAGAGESDDDDTGAVSQPDDDDSDSADSADSATGPQQETIRGETEYIPQAPEPGVEGQEDDLGEAAQELEQRAIAQNDLADGISQGVEPEALVRVERDSGQLEAELTDLGRREAGRQAVVEQSDQLAQDDVGLRDIEVTETDDGAQVRVFSSAEGLSTRVSGDRMFRGGERDRSRARGARDFGATDALFSTAAGMGLSERLLRERRLSGARAGDPEASLSQRFESRETARARQAEEQFGDIDFSFGFGDPDVDEVERVTDETLPTAVDEGPDYRRGDVELDIPGTGDVAGFFLEEEIEGARRPRMGPAFATANVPVATEGARMGQAAVQSIEDVSRLPAAALELIELGPYVAAQPADRGAEVGRAAAQLGEQAARSAASNPQQTTRSLLVNAPFEAAVAAGGGRALGTAARASRSRLRVAGATTIDAEDLTQPEVIRAADADAPGGDEFPGAVDADLYRSDPPQAIRQQADEMTPDVVQQRFAEAGVEEGAVLKKALDVEPEGPTRPGFTGTPDETGIDPEDITRADLSNQEDRLFSYETPGAFLSTDLSPYFLGDESRTAGFSLRPGLPDLGDESTAVFVRTTVDAADASDDLEFAREMAEREGGTEAVTKPASEVNAGEIEAVVPPGAEFADIGGGFGRSTLRRLGIGSDFAVDVGGRRVPARTVADPELVDQGLASRSFSDFVGSERGQVGADTSSLRTRTLSEIRGAGRDPIDRPLPVAPAPTVATTDAETGAPSVAAGQPRPTRGGGGSASRRTQSTVRGPGSDAVSRAAAGGATVDAITAVASADDPSDSNPAPSGISGGGAGVPLENYPGVGGSDPEESRPVPSAASSRGGPGGPEGGAPNVGLPELSISLPIPETTPPADVPDLPSTRPPRRRPDPDEGEADERDEQPAFAADFDPAFVDFIDPLSGGLLQTERGTRSTPELTF